jgi:NAD(P)-dependent dehydrogenase (short-subunit alcohol dehydrogenase family)
MNIVVVGGGQPGKFGNDFCLRARQEGHNVFILSHKDYGTGDPQHLYADHSERQYMVEAFNKLTESIDNIDIFVFNGRMDGYASMSRDFTSTAKITSIGWHTNLHFTIILPHVLSIEALKKMSKGSKIVFLTTGMALKFDRTDYTAMAGYAGLKAAQIHLMVALAHHNDKGAIASSVSPHFPYEDRQAYLKVFNKVYDYILTFDESKNGCVETIH